METIQNEQRVDEREWDSSAHPTSGSAPNAPRRTALSLEHLASVLGDHASARTVFGDPVHAEGVTVIPAARVIWGYGGGSGEALPAAAAAGEVRPGRAPRPGWGTGGGGGVVVTPVGYIVIRNGDAHFRPAPARGRLLAAAAAGALVGALVGRRVSA